MVWSELKYKVEVVKDYGGIPQIECFASQRNQELMNLLMNASHAIEERGQITIRTRHDEDNVWVDIQDTGKGIQSEHMRRIFEPFFTTEPVGKGTTCRAVLPKQAKARVHDASHSPKNGANVQDRAA